MLFNYITNKSLRKKPTMSKNKAIGQKISVFRVSPVYGGIVERNRFYYALKHDIPHRSVQYYNTLLVHSIK